MGKLSPFIQVTIQSMCKRVEAGGTFINHRDSKYQVYFSVKFCKKVIQAF